MNRSCLLFARHCVDDVRNKYFILAELFEFRTDDVYKFIENRQESRMFCQQRSF